MPAYLVAELAVKDAAKLREYGERVAAVVREHGGSVLVRAPVKRVAVGRSCANSVAVLAFDSIAALEGFLDSDAYRSIVPLRDAAADATFLILASE